MAALQVNVSKSRQAGKLSRDAVRHKTSWSIVFLMLASNIEICTYGIQLSEMGHALV